MLRQKPSDARRRITPRSAAREARPLYCEVMARTSRTHVVLEPMRSRRGLVRDMIVTRRDQRSRLIDPNNHDRSNPSRRVKQPTLGEELDVTIKLRARAQYLGRALETGSLCARNGRRRSPRFRVRAQIGQVPGERMSAKMRCSSSKDGDRALGRDIRCAVRADCGNEAQPLSLDEVLHVLR